MEPLYRLKTLRLSYSTFSPRIKRFIVGDLKPSYISFGNQIIPRFLASEISKTPHNVTVTYLIDSCGFSPEAAISASKRFKLQSPERADSVLALLRSHGFSQTQISKLLRTRLEVLALDPEKILLPKIEFFSSLGVSRQDLAKTLAYNPHLLTRSLEKILVPTYDFLRSLLSEKNVVAVFKRNSWIFQEGHSKHVAPNIAILKEMGMPQSCISLLLAHFPGTLTQNTEKFNEVVDEVNKLGFDMQTSTSVYAISAFCRTNSKCIWSRNVGVYNRWGWSEDDVLSAFRKNPKCMVLSESKIMQVMQFFVQKMGWPSEMIAKNPLIMSYSLEKRIIPRCSVVKALLLKGFINEIENFSLWKVLLPAESDFLNKFVTRYIDEVPRLLSVYEGKVEAQDV